MRVAVNEINLRFEFRIVIIIYIIILYIFGHSSGNTTVALYSKPLETYVVLIFLFLFRAINFVIILCIVYARENDKLLQNTLSE